MKRTTSGGWYAEFELQSGRESWRASPGAESRNAAMHWIDRVRIALHRIFPVNWEPKS